LQLRARCRGQASGACRNLATGPRSSHVSALVVSAQATIQNACLLRRRQRRWKPNAPTGAPRKPPPRRPAQRQLRSAAVLGSMTLRRTTERPASLARRRRGRRAALELSSPAPPARATVDEVDSIEAGAAELRELRAPGPRRPARRTGTSWRRTRARGSSRRAWARPALERRLRRRMRFDWSYGKAHSRT